MTGTPTEPAGGELAHQLALLRTYTRHLQALEQQIALLGPAHAPAHLLAQRDLVAAERARALRRARRLERGRAGGGASAAPRADARLLNPALPTGVLHLMDADELPLVALDLANPTRGEVVFSCSSWIEERSFTRSDRVVVPAGGAATLHQLPTLRAEALAQAGALSRATLQVRVSALARRGEAPLLAQSFEIGLLARDVLLWESPRADGALADRSALVGAWVTPNAPSVVELLRRAAARAPGRQLVGYQGGGAPAERAGLARGQVRAIYEALQADAAIACAAPPLGVGPGAVGQRISLPRDSLACGLAGGIDGAVLYASLIERAGLHAALAIVPGHAFVGWETWEGSGVLEFLETTMTAGHSFDEAWRRGCAQFVAAEPLLGRPRSDPGGFARLLRLPELRRAGVLPME